MFANVPLTAAPRPTAIARRWTRTCRGVYTIRIHRPGNVPICIYLYYLLAGHHHRQPVRAGVDHVRFRALNGDGPEIPALFTQIRRLAQMRTFAQTRVPHPIVIKRRRVVDTIGCGGGGLVVRFFYRSTDFPHGKSPGRGYRYCFVRDWRSQTLLR